MKFNNLIMCKKVNVNARAMTQIETTRLVVELSYTNTNNVPLKLEGSVKGFE